MIGVTLFGLLFTPVFYVILRAIVERRARKPLPFAAHAAP
jgi:multidrug efflux pump